VAGRSNVGKSSLLNWLFRQTVARVAKAPGKTRTLNFYLVNRNFYLVDLPGYGYAQVSRSVRQQWQRELTRYLAEEDRLVGVVALLDVRHGLMPNDSELFDVIRERGAASWSSSPGGQVGRQRGADAAGCSAPMGPPPCRQCAREGRRKHCPGWMGC
jgi:ribosome biogenesis GTP-binding protein YsxC/EngB